MLLLEVPITFEVDAGVTHAPMVQAHVGRAQTRLILDTGSTDHILTTTLIDSLGMTAEPGDPGTDSTGASVPSWKVSQVAVAIGDRSFPLRDVVVIAAPEPFQAWGIGGFLSPQHLHETATVVLDLAGDRLILLEHGGTDPTGWLTDRFPDLVPLSLEPVLGEGTVRVRAAIDPFEPVVTMLDTGAKRTQFATVAVPGLKGGARRSSGRGVGGREGFGLEIQGRTLHVGGANLPVPTLLLGTGINEAQGLIGMDLLRGTVLAVGSDPSRPVLWLVPPERRPLPLHL